MRISENNLKLLKEAIEKNRTKKGALMPILHEAQKIFGAIPFEVQKFISKELSISMAEIYGVTTFYSQFTLVPNGENLISVCMGTACYVRGAQDIINSFSEKLGVKLGETTSDGRYTLQATRCVGACALAPVVNANEEIFSKMKSADVDKVLKKQEECSCQPGVRITVASAEEVKEYRYNGGEINANEN